jgi:phenylacetate-CoA ligase
MPLIRYSLGDIAAPSDESCSCGRELPLMKVIDGKADDFLTLPNGEYISPRRVALLEYVNGIDRFRIIQERKDKILVQIETEYTPNNEMILEIKNIFLKGLLNEDIDVIVEPVKKITRDKSGKIRMIQSKVK